MAAFRGKKEFTIRTNDYGSIAYHSQYVVWLENELLESKEVIGCYEAMKKGVAIRIANLEAERDKVQELLRIVAGAPPC